MSANYMSQAWSQDERDELQDDSQDGEQEQDDEEDVDLELTKKKKPGIVYLSTIPPRMNVQLLREALTPYGEIGRIFLQVDTSIGKTQKKARKFTEGWVEFKSKRAAKLAAETLNNHKVGGKRRSPNYEVLWNMKYLPRFKWAHLNERLAYEKAVHQQRMRTEIAQVKRETNYFTESADRSKRLSKKMDKLASRRVVQKPTDEEVSSRKPAKADRSEFLKNLFKSGS